MEIGEWHKIRLPLSKYVERCVCPDEIKDAPIEFDAVIMDICDDNKIIVAESYGLIRRIEESDIIS